MVSMLDLFVGVQDDEATSAQLVRKSVRNVFPLPATQFRTTWISRTSTTTSLPLPSSQRRPGPTPRTTHLSAAQRASPGPSRKLLPGSTLPARELIQDVCCLSTRDDDFDPDDGDGSASSDVRSCS